MADVAAQPARVRAEIVSVARAVAACNKRTSRQSLLVLSVLSVLSVSSAVRTHLPVDRGLRGYRGWAPDAVEWLRLGMPNQAAAPNPARSPRLPSGHSGRGVGEP